MRMLSHRRLFVFLTGAVGERGPLPSRAGHSDRSISLRCCNQLSPLIPFSRSQDATSSETLPEGGFAPAAPRRALFAVAGAGCVAPGVCSVGAQEEGGSHELPAHRSAPGRGVSSGRGRAALPVPAAWPVPCPGASGPAGREQSQRTGAGSGARQGWKRVQRQEVYPGRRK